MRKYPAPRREYRPTGITTQFLETIEDEPDYDDGDEVLSADDERPQPSLQRPQALDEAEEVTLIQEANRPMRVPVLRMRLAHITQSREFKRASADLSMNVMLPILETRAYGFWACAGMLTRHTGAAGSRSSTGEGKAGYRQQTAQRGV